MAVSEEKNYLKKIISAQHSFTDTPRVDKIRGSYSQNLSLGFGK